MARFIQVNASDEVTGYRETLTAPPDSPTQRFIQVPEDGTWDALWDDLVSKGAYFFSGSPRYLYDSALNIIVLQVDDTVEVRAILASKKAEAGTRIDIDFEYFGALGVLDPTFDGELIASLNMDSGSLPVRLVFSNGTCQLRFTPDGGRYDITAGRDPDNPNAARFRVIGNNEFTIFLNAS